MPDHLDLKCDTYSAPRTYEPPCDDAPRGARNPSTCRRENP